MSVTEPITSGGIFDLRDAAVFALCITETHSRGGPANDIKTELSFLVRFGTNHPSRRRHVTLNAITNVLSVAALRVTSLITRVRTPYVIHEMDQYARWWAHSG